MTKKKLSRILREIKSSIFEVIFTHGKKSSKILFDHYNVCLEDAIKNNYIEKDSFLQPLEKDLDMVEIGISAGLLESALREGDKLINALEEIKRLAEEFNMPETDNSSLLIKYYNMCLNYALNQGKLEEGSLFKELKDNTSMIDIGITAGLLAKYIMDDDYNDDCCFIHKVKINCDQSDELKTEAKITRIDN